ncbi:MAG: hypothetical protein LBN25_04270, partial [Christensenellaceae bacterium]|nr:hypothetical protein [Christensenellaceae bacterium]
NRLAIKDAVPDITVFFDVPPRDIFREKGTMSDRFENLNSDYHDKVYQGYKEGLSFFQQQFPDSLEIVLSPKKGDIQGSFRDIVSRIKNYI